MFNDIIIIITPALYHGAGKVQTCTTACRLRPRTHNDVSHLPAGRPQTSLRSAEIARPYDDVIIDVYRKIQDTPALNEIGTCRFESKPIIYTFVSGLAVRTPRTTAGFRRQRRTWKVRLSDGPGALSCVRFANECAERPSSSLADDARGNIIMSRGRCDDRHLGVRRRM